MILAYPFNGFHGLFIEQKTGRNKLSKDKTIRNKNGVFTHVREGQETWGERLTQAGYRFEVSYSPDQTILIVKNHLGIE
ncbi:MAG: hypothetical protein GY866_41740 [Proteobacteria bacterium]|nr:hypothetical protein [Pseudomonadota bacterium]